MAFCWSWCHPGFTLMRPCFPTEAWLSYGLKNLCPFFLCHEVLQVSCLFSGYLPCCLPSRLFISSLMCLQGSWIGPILLFHGYGPLPDANAQDCRISSQVQVTQHGLLEVYIVTIRHSGFSFAIWHALRSIRSTQEGTFQVCASLQFQTF